ncbi:MAG: hypothetical protein ACTJHV_13405, partial [Cellulosimicrobium funkei]
MDSVRTSIIGRPRPRPRDRHAAGSSTDDYTPIREEPYKEHARDLKIGLVIPQGSLRESVAKVFKRTPGLDKSMVMNAFDVGKSVERFDLLLVDESHRLTRRANQPSAALNTSYADINRKLFGEDDPS